MQLFKTMQLGKTWILNRDFKNNKMNLLVSFAWELIPEIFVSGVKGIIKFQTGLFHPHISKWSDHILMIQYYPNGALGSKRASSLVFLKQRWRIWDRGCGSSSKTLPLSKTFIFHKAGSAELGPSLHYAAINWGCWVISHDALKTSMMCLYATAAGH